MSEMSLDNPTANQILIYSELSGKFENTDFTVDLIEDFTYISSAMNLNNEAQIYNDNVGGVLRFRGIVGKNGLTATNVGSNVEITFNGDAATLGGISKDGYLQTSNSLGDVNPQAARNSLQVYSTQESDDLFLEANASNIPDLDNTYDVGSNGNRFANMFAVTFHGNATHSSIAGNIERNGALDGQILVWRQSENSWVPENSISNTLLGLNDVDAANLQHESVIVYNSVRSKFEMIPSSYFKNGTGSGTTTPTEGESTGDGTAVYSGSLGNKLRFRSIKGSTNVGVNLNYLNDEIVITADIPNTTSDLPEGVNKYYKRDYFLHDMKSVSIQQLANVDVINAPNAGQSPVWSGTQWEWRNASVDLFNSDSLNEGSVNLYYTTDRVNTAIDAYFTTNVTLSDLSDVYVVPTNNDFLYFNSINSRWQSRKVSMYDLSDVNMTNIQNEYTIAWDTNSNKFLPTKLPKFLSDLQETNDSLAFNSTSFNAMLATKTTADLPEHSIYKYLTVPNLITTAGDTSIGVFKDMNIQGITTGNIIVWDDVRNGFVPADASALNITVSVSLSELSDVDNSSVINAVDNDMLIFDTTLGMFVAKQLDVKLDDITDVVISSIDNNQGIVWDGIAYVNRYIPNTDIPLLDGDLLVYNATDNKFDSLNVTNIVADIFNIDGIEYTTKTNNDVLMYNSVLGKFENRQLKISTMSDIDTTNRQDGYVIVYSNANNSHEYTKISNSLVDLVDVDTTGLAVGDLLHYDGSKFINNNVIDVLGIVGDIGDFIAIGSNGLESSTIGMGSLNDITLPLLPIDSQDYVLRWDMVSSKFILEEITIPPKVANTTDLSDVDVIAPTNGQVLVYNAVKGKYEPSDPPTAAGSLTGGTYDRNAGSNQTVFTIPHEGKVWVWANGILLPNSELILSNHNVVELVTARILNDHMRFMVIVDANATTPTVGSMNGQEFEFVSTIGQTEYTIEHDNATLMVFVKGILFNSSQYVITGTDKLILTTPRESGDVVKVLKLQ